MNTSDLFYEDLPVFQDFSELTDLGHYQLLPDDWFVVIADIRGSTKAIHDGFYKEVNIIGAATIMTVINSVRPLLIPYVFGGDGATLPPTFRWSAALRGSATHIA